jgi:hypothetical protein
MTERKRKKVGQPHQANDPTRPTDEDSAPPLQKKSRKRTRTSRESAAPPTSGAPSGIDGSDARRFAEAREEMIRIAAYYLAQERGFAPGAELDDWLAAEIAIDRKLNE